MWWKWIVYWLLSVLVVSLVLYQIFSAKSRFAPPPSPDETKKMKEKTRNEKAAKKD
jgi:uncharacterized protein YpmS